MNPRSAVLSAALAAAVVATPLAWSVLSPGAAAAPDGSTPASTPAPVAASVPAPAPAPAAAPQAEAGPPVLRVQDVLSHGSPRRTALFEAYTTCLLDHGAPTVDESLPAPDVAYSRDRGAAVAFPVPTAVERACAELEPVYPPSMEAATNPGFADQAASYVTCLRDNGQWVRLLNDRDLSWTYVAGHDVPDDNARIEDACLLANFGD